MKKILAIIAIAISGTAFAGSITVEGAKINTVGGNDQMNSNFTLSETVNKTFSVHTQLSSTQTDNTNAVSTRLEVGGTATTPIYGPVTGYAKLAIGQKFSTAGSGQFTYYSIEPGLSVPLSSSLTAKVGYRYRTAMDNPNVNKDTTDTVRVGVTYAISKKDAVGFRFDRITGDSRQDGYNVFYTRSF
jgi:opacity protein-like surface antigen